MVNPGNWGAYPSFVQDNILYFGVIHQRGYVATSTTPTIEQIQRNAASQTLLPLLQQLLHHLN
jgi:hypothetical protein